jgi:hypothetical protein
MQGDQFNPRWFRAFIHLIIRYRYPICILVALAIGCLWFFLYLNKSWAAKDASQICTGFFIVITLFFAALNFEFANSKMQKDKESARELLTYNTATEWYKSPLKDYQKTSIGFETAFASSAINRFPEYFKDFINNPKNIDYKESLKGILNHFETVAIGIYKNLIDKDFMREFYRHIFHTYYVDYYFYIELQRSNNKKIWINFTNLVEEWHSGIKDQLQKEPVRSSIITHHL